MEKSQIIDKNPIEDRSRISNKSPIENRNQIIDKSPIKNRNQIITKNQIVEVTIEDMTEKGEGLGRADGCPLFIKDTVIGDRVRAKVIKMKKTYGYARLVEVLSPSSDRVEPRCPVAGPCGGCQLQAMSYEAQLRFKQRKVAGHLERIGGFQDLTVLPVIGMEDPFGYRNKAQFPVGRDREGRIVAGFYAGRTHHIIETKRCYLGQPVNEEVLAAVKTWMTRFGIEPYDEETHRGLVRHVLIRVGKATGQVMVCLVICGGKVPRAKELVEALLRIPGMTSISYNINRSPGNVILGPECRDLYGDGAIEDRIGDLTFRISPLSFYQVNPGQTEKLYAEALACAGLTGEEVVWDLYCGIGTISLFLARRAKRVYGVEIVPQAVEDARENARRNGINNAEFFAGKAEEVLPRWVREHGEQVDVIVTDPPRKGCEQSLLALMVRMAPRRIVYVSCDSATLARDLKVLCAGGYEIERVQPVDMFGMSVHVETCVSLAKRIKNPEDF